MQPAPVSTSEVTPAVSVLAWELLATLTPDSFEGFTATAEPQGRVVDLPAGTQLSTVKRSYMQGAVKLEMDALDAANADGVRQMFAHASELARETERAVTRPTSVQGHKALIQYYKPTQTARLGVLIDNRIVMNFNITPATEVDAALQLAKKYDFSAAAKLITDHPVSAPAAAPSAQKSEPPATKTDAPSPSADKPTSKSAATKAAKTAP